MKSYDYLNFSIASVVQFPTSRYIMHLIRTSGWKVMNISRELRLHNFELLDILCAWIRYPSEKLWPFKFFESIHCSISSVLIYYVPESDIRVKSYEHLNFLLASVVQFRVSRYNMFLNRTSKWKVMTIGISRQRPFFNFELLDILCTQIGYPSQKSPPFELFDSFRCSISSVVIYYAT